MRDGPAERGLRGCLRVGVNELPVLGRLGEFVDALLFDRKPARDADFLTDALADFIEGGNWHECQLERGGRRGQVRRAHQLQLFRLETFDKPAEDR